MIDVNIWCTSWLTRWFMNQNPVICRVSYIPGGNLDFFQQYYGSLGRFGVWVATGEDGDYLWSAAWRKRATGVVGASLINRWFIHRFGKWQSFWRAPKSSRFDSPGSIWFNSANHDQNAGISDWMKGLSRNQTRGGDTFGQLESSSLGDFSGFQKAWYLKQKIGLGRTSRRCVKFLSLYLWRNSVGWLVGWFEFNFGWPASCQSSRRGFYGERFPSRALISQTSLGFFWVHFNHPFLKWKKWCFFPKNPWTPGGVM